MSKADSPESWRKTVRLKARMAICRIAPEDAPEHLPELATNLWRTADFLADSTAQADRIAELLRSRLHSEEPWQALQAADVLVRLGRCRADCERALERWMTAAGSRENESEQRSYPRAWAAYVRWRLTGDSAQALPLLMAALRSQDDMPVQAAPDEHGKPIRHSSSDFLISMGLAARPAIPELRQLLWHRYRTVRHDAGRVLRAIAPEELPSVNEGGALSRDRSAPSH
ncbi:MAG: hypothetical protein HYY24_01200 [Verrucomicrobia bacterium]|nr:hypothetical protein [Verrucomicrobiota bacterium]